MSDNLQTDIDTGLSAEDFVACAMTNPINAALLDRLPELRLNQCFLNAGCLFQATWNRLSGYEADRGVKDYDVSYFDDSDLSWEAEDRVIRAVAKMFAGIAIEIRNQARVHLWYRRRFGVDYPQLSSTRDGIDRYLISCTCVGIDVATGKLYAPNGLDDLHKGILRINPRNRQPELFRQKAEDYRTRWPWLTVAEHKSED
jgi:hypothetical protein